MLCPALFCLIEDVEPCRTRYRTRDAVPRWIQYGIGDTVPTRGHDGILGSGGSLWPWKLSCVLCALRA